MDWMDMTRDDTVLFA